MKKFKLSLENKALLGIIFVLLPILITFFIVYNQNRAYLKQRILDTLTVIAEAYEGQVYQFLERAKMRAQDFASDGCIGTQIQKAIHGNTSAMNKLNKHLIKNKLTLDKTINTINVLSLDGRVIASTNSAEIGSDYSSETIFQKGKETVTMVEKCFGHSELTEIAISAPIVNKDTGRLIGVIVNYIPIAELDNIVTGKYSHDVGAVSLGKKKGDWQTLEVYLVNRDKRMITKSIFVKDAVGKQVVDTLPINEGLTSNKWITGFYRDYRGVEVGGASVYIPSMKWVLLVEIDKDEALAPVQYILINTCITAAVVIAILVVLYSAFIKKIVKPLHIVSKAAKDIAGDHIGIVVPVQTDDEIGMLCESFNSMSHDIEVRTTALRKVSKSLAQAQQIAHVGNWEWDIVNNEAYWSDELYRIFGFAPQEFVVTYDSFLNCIHPYDREFVGKSVDEALQGKKQYDIEFRILHKDGSVRIIHEKGIVICGPTGRAIRMTGMSQDITERKKMEEEQAKLREQLYHVQKLESVGTLAGGVAHDFNNILTAIIGYGTLLQKDMKEGGPSRDYVKKILKSAERAADLTQGLLAFSRKQISNPRPVYLNEIVKGVEGILVRVMREDIKLKTSLTDKECVVMADVGQMEQVLMNLATNARDAMPDGGFLNLSTDTVKIDNAYIKAHGYGEIGMYALITVSDTGVGMDKKTKERIFEPFFTTKGVGKGTGLGLAIVYGIVKQHNGYINIYSEPGKGTTFRIYLPVIESEVEKKKTEAHVVHKGGTETILIAEDEEDVREITKIVLEGHGYTVIEAVDGEDAIDKFRENKDKIHLLLFDVIMPNKNGKEAYKAIKEMRPDIKALFMSGYSEDIVSKKDVPGKGFKLIVKPVSPTELLKRVGEALDT